MLDGPESLTEIEKAWTAPQVGHPMFQVCARIKECRVTLLKMKGELSLNAGHTIKTVKNEMLAMQHQGGNRDWGRWKVAYQDE